MSSLLRPATRPERSPSKPRSFFINAGLSSIAASFTFCYTQTRHTTCPHIKIHTYLTHINFESKLTHQPQDKTAMCFLTLSPRPTQNSHQGRGSEGGSDDGDEAMEMEMARGLDWIWIWIWIRQCCGECAGIECKGKKEVK